MRYFETYQHKSKEKRPPCCTYAAIITYKEKNPNENNIKR